MTNEELYEELKRFWRQRNWPSKIHTGYLTQEFGLENRLLAVKLGMIKLRRFNQGHFLNVTVVSLSNTEKQVRLYLENQDYYVLSENWDNSLKKACPNVIDLLSEKDYNGEWESDYLGIQMGDFNRPNHISTNICNPQFQSLLGVIGYEQGLKHLVEVKIHEWFVGEKWDLDRVESAFLSGIIKRIVKSYWYIEPSFWVCQMIKEYAYITRRWTRRTSPIEDWAQTFYDINPRPGGVGGPGNIINIQ